METEEYKGIVEDPRTPEEKGLDYKHEDIAHGIQTFEWKEKTEDQLKKFKIRNQDGSLACVSFGTAKILGMHEVLEGRPFIDLSPKFIYTRRQNYPDGGMWLPNALAIACKSGACLETSLPCDDKAEAYMNDKGQEKTSNTEEALDFRAKYYFEITNRNIDNIAQIMEQGYGVLLGFRFDYDEWVDVPFINPLSQKRCGHGIAGVDYMLHEGKKALLIEDSWGVGFGKGGRRIITEEFLNERCFYAGYITSLPNYVFTKTLKMGDRGIDVKKLQERLKIKVDGKFGGQTLGAVKEFQRQHGLKDDGIVGKLTNAELNK